jgi:hypothetical protein
VFVGFRSRDKSVPVLYTLFITFIKDPCRLIYTQIKALNLNSVNQLIFVMVKYGVLFEVRTEFLNNI